MQATIPTVRTRARLATALALALLAALTVLAWRYLIGAASVPVGHAAAHVPGVAFVAMSIAMWSAMMVAMMLPGASPMIVTFATVVQRRGAACVGLAPTWLFVAGYLAVWSGFSAVAAVAQWALHAHALLDGAMGRTGPLLGAGLLVVAGIFQRTALKQACLAKCRTPLSFVLTEWRAGWRGAFVMGLRHGAFCVGCCWALMLLMFVGGVMSLVWMGGLAVYMLAEKVVPGGARLSRASGLVLIAAGAAIALGSAVPA